MSTEVARQVERLGNILITVLAGGTPCPLCGCSMERSKPYDGYFVWKCFHHHLGSRSPGGYSIPPEPIMVDDNGRITYNFTPVFCTKSLVSVTSYTTKENR